MVPVKSMVLPCRITNHLVWNHAENFYDCLGPPDLEMLKEQRSTTSSEDFSGLPIGETLDIRTIIQECIQLPPLSQAPS
jgi:hypothetical protein